MGGLPPAGQPQPLQPGEFVSASHPGEVHFDTKGGAAPPALYVRPEEVIIATVIGASTVKPVIFSYRLLRVDGTLQVGSYTIAPLTAGVVGNNTQQLTEGFLLSCSLSVGSASVPPGQIYGTLALARGSVPTFGLASFALPLTAGYITTDRPLVYPGGPMESVGSGQGNLRSVTVTNPAAGTDWTVTPIGNARWRIVSLTATLTTSATAGTRIPRLQITSLSKTLWQAPATATVAPSLTVLVSTGQGQVTSTIDTATINVPLPGNTVLTSAFILGTSTTALAAGDQWSAITLFVEEWSGSAV